MKLGPLFFGTSFNREDGDYNKYTVVSEDTESYDLLENGNFIMNFLDLGKAIQYFKDEFDVEITN